MKRFYVLVNRAAGNRKASSTDYLPNDSVETKDAPKCSRCGKYLGMRPLVGDIIVELELWSNSADDVCFGPGDEVLFSDRLKAAFESLQLKGAEFRSVKISNTISHKRGCPEIPSYYLTSISRSRALVDTVASGIEWESEIDCEECHIDGVIKRCRKIILIPDTWSGEDIFFARGLPGIIITSQSFFEMCVNVGSLANALIPIEEFSFDYYPWENKARP